MKKYGKFAALIAIVIGALVWLASTGVNETKTYYKTIAELGQMGDRAFSNSLRSSDICFMSCPIIPPAPLRT